MKPFRFELDAVLRLRARIEDERAGELGRRRRAHAAVLDEIDAIDREIARRLADRRERLGESGAVDVARVSLDAAAVAALRAQRGEAVERAERAEADVERARGALARAAVERKAVDSLRIKRFEAWKREAARREQAELDDLAGSGRDRGARGVSNMMIEGGWA